MELSVQSHPSPDFLFLCAKCTLPLIQVLLMEQNMYTSGPAQHARLHLFCALLLSFAEPWVHVKLLRFRQLKHVQWHQWDLCFILLPGILHVLCKAILRRPGFCEFLKQLERVFPTSLLMIDHIFFVILPFFSPVMFDFSRFSLYIFKDLKKQCSRFTTKLQRSSLYPLSILPHAQPSSKSSTAVVQLMPLCGHTIITSGPQFMLQFILPIVHSIGLDKCTLTPLQHDSTIHNMLIALKLICNLPTQPSPPALILDNHQRSFYYFQPHLLFSYLKVCKNLERSSSLPSFCVFITWEALKVSYFQALQSEILIQLVG